MIKKITVALYIAATLMMVRVIWGLANFGHTDVAGVTMIEKSHPTTGWNQKDSIWYYFGNDGKKVTGWIMDGEKYYYLKNDGSMAVGKVEIKNSIYEFDQNGALLCDTIVDDELVPNSILPSREKFEGSPKYSWFDDNGKTYFRMDKSFAAGPWNIDGESYAFDKNGVMLKCVAVTSTYGAKFLYGNDGKCIKVSYGNLMNELPYGVMITKSSTDNQKVLLDDSNMMEISEVDSNGEIVYGKGIKATKDITKLQVETKGKTLYCKPKQIVQLGNIKVSGTDTDRSLLPSLVIMSKSTDESIAYAGVDVSLKDGYINELHPKILVYKPGNTTVTIDVNGTQTTFDIVVSQ
ncbi:MULTISPECIES: cell wall-binding protein [unclassified Clostridium]|uniref:N-acetylmuramoyl-L-alanine amidase family protein n=1 Tax=unclassified Clostridium TaxID=2614128 RepID=UPI00029761C8|nr:MULTISPECIES: cell wall-binding protein [unclassified Clostridium]EKQ56102.1 MAG: putative cell wall binding protein [Clostridium sp. Maddingley MBC34-26]